MAGIAVAPEVGIGHLCLVGAGEYLDDMVPVDAALLALTPAVADCRTPRVVCLPTAAGTEGDAVVERWMRMGVDHFRGLRADVQALRVIDRAGADDEAVAREIDAADLVYLSGGKPPHLLASLRDTAAWRSLLGVVARGGVVAGCSAGAMILGSWILRWPSLALRREGFGLLPDAIVVPHFDEHLGRVARAALHRRPAASYLLGIDRMTGLVVGEDGFDVLGEGRVTVSDGDGARELRAESAPA